MEFCNETFVNNDVSTVESVNIEKRNLKRRHEQTVEIMIDDFTKTFGGDDNRPSSNRNYKKRPTLEPQLNHDQKSFLEYIEYKEYKNEPIKLFVSGAAGTGKSFLLKRTIENLTKAKKNVWVAAYTNLAANNVNGRTLHKCFGFNLKLETRRDIAKELPDYLLIDEISMVPAAMLDKISDLCRPNEDSKPFNNMSVIVFGDLYQLPPIDGNNGTAAAPYRSKVWKHFKLLELTENNRQTEPAFIQALNQLRIGDERCIEFFNQKVQTEPLSISEKIKYTSLVSTHREADVINKECYARVRTAIDPDTEERTVPYSKTEMPRRKMSKRANVYKSSQEELIFKQNMLYCVGARVMVTLNQDYFSNGDIGIVERVNDDKTVCIRRERDSRLFTLKVARVFFDNSEDFTLVYCVECLPIVHAWAVTIHKAQGMTLKNLIVYPKNVFASGQAYVALSRAVDCDGLKLMQPIPGRAINQNLEISQVYKDMKIIQIFYYDYNEGVRRHASDDSENEDIFV